MMQNEFKGAWPQVKIQTISSEPEVLLKAFQKSLCENVTPYLGERS
jgi:hypothetical protein